MVMPAVSQLLVLSTKVPCSIVGPKRTADGGRFHIDTVRSTQGIQLGIPSPVVRASTIRGTRHESSNASIHLPASATS